MALLGLMDYAQLHKEQVVFALILDLAVQYPEDIGLFSPLILNVLALQPGEAIYLEVCTPHAYIKGSGLEIMANSDNVLRAGLTPKHIDVIELVSCTRFLSKPSETLIFAPEKVGSALCYSIPVDDFKFRIFEYSQKLALSREGLLS